VQFVGEHPGLHVWVTVHDAADLRLALGVILRR